MTRQIERGKPRARQRNKSGLFFTHFLTQKSTPLSRWSSRNIYVVTLPAAQKRTSKYPFLKPEFVGGDWLNSHLNRVIRTCEAAAASFRLLSRATATAEIKLTKFVTPSVLPRPSVRNRRASGRAKREIIRDKSHPPPSSLLASSYLLVRSRQIFFYLGDDDSFNCNNDCELKAK